jgi:hypothetical protein
VGTLGNSDETTGETQGRREHEDMGKTLGATTPRSWMQEPHTSAIKRAIVVGSHLVTRDLPLVRTPRVVEGPQEMAEGTGHAREPPASNKLNVAFLSTELAGDPAL